MIIPVKITYDRATGKEISRETADVPPEVIAAAIIKAFAYIDYKDVDSAP